MSSYACTVSTGYTNYFIVVFLPPCLNYGIHCSFAMLYLMEQLNDQNLKLIYLYNMYCALYKDYSTN